MLANLANTLPPNWGLQQINKLSQQRPELVNRAIQRLIESDEDLRWVIAISAYQSGDISLAKTAELLGLHALALRTRFLKLGIPIRLGPGTLEEAKAEVEALRLWRSESPEQAG
jgi:predicted HTH domain antitoxin